MDGQLNDFEYEALVYQAKDRKIMMFRIIMNILRYEKFEYV